MNDCIDQQILKKVRPPQQAEIWYADDDKILMDDPQKVDKNNRPVLVVSHLDLLKTPCNMVNVIPLSTSGSPDKIRFPIGAAYENICNDFRPNPNSMALLALYQPIRISCFSTKCARIDLNTYSAIIRVLCQSVIGLEEFNFTV